MLKSDEPSNHNMGKQTQYISTEEEVRDIEITLAVTLSEEYKRYLTTTGIPRRAIKVRALSNTDVMLHVPQDVIKQTQKRQQLGMPKDLVQVGRDNCGNGVCLKPQHDEAVYLFDHDLLMVYPIANNFNELVNEIDEE